MFGHGEVHQKIRKEARDDSTETRRELQKMIEILAEELGYEFYETTAMPPMRSCIAIRKKYVEGKGAG